MFKIETVFQHDIQEVLDKAQEIVTVFPVAGGKYSIIYKSKNVSLTKDQINALTPDERLTLANKR